MSLTESHKTKTGWHCCMQPWHSASTECKAAPHTACYWVLTSIACGKLCIGEPTMLLTPLPLLLLLLQAPARKL